MLHTTTAKSPACLVLYHHWACLTMALRLHHTSPISIPNSFPNSHNMVHIHLRLNGAISAQTRTCRGKPQSRCTTPGESYHGVIVCARRGIGYSGHYSLTRLALLLAFWHLEWQSFAQEIGGYPQIGWTPSCEVEGRYTPSTVQPPWKEMACSREDGGGWRSQEVEGPVAHYHRPMILSTWSRQ